MGYGLSCFNSSIFAVSLAITAYVFSFSGGNQVYHKYSLGMVVVVFAWCFFN